MDLIAYHNSCPDGFTAAYIVKKRYPEAELLPLDHGMQNFPIEKFVGKDALMVDWSRRTKAENQELASITKSFRILDHHKTAQAELENEFYAVFDMNRSGAGLAWDYLFGKDSGLSGHINGPEAMFKSWERPWWVNYVEDRDLWRHQLPSSREVNAYIGTLPMTVTAWDSLSQINVEQAIKLGEGALAHIEHYVREAVKHAQFGTIFVAETPEKQYARSVAVLNVPYLNCSEVGNVLAKGSDVGLTYFERGDQIIQFSLRSIGDIDVSAIAKTFNGGGHKNAAGFQLPYLRGRKLIDTILNRSIEDQLHQGGR